MLSSTVAAALVAASKTCPGVALICWGFSGAAPRRHSAAFNAAAILCFALMYYALNYAYTPRFYVESALAVIALSSALAITLCSRSSAVSAFLGASASMCLLIMQALSASVVAFFQGDFNAFVATNALSVLIDLAACAMSIPPVYLLRKWIVDDAQAQVGPASMLALLPSFAIYTCFAVWQLPLIDPSYASIDSMPAVIMVAVAFASVLTMLVYPLILREAKVRADLSVMDQLVHSKYRNLVAQDDIAEETSRFMHDLKNQLQSLAVIDDEGAQLDHLRSIEDQLSRFRRTSYTDSPVFDALFNQKRDEARACGIDYKVAPFHIRESPMESVDVCALVGNALDNAIEACQRLPEESFRFIDVRIAHVGEYLVITICNSCDKNLVVDSSGWRAESSKRPDGRAGYGIANMRRATEKYGGGLEMRASDGVFEVVSAIPISPK